MCAFHVFLLFIYFLIAHGFNFVNIHCLIFCCCLIYQCLPFLCFFFAGLCEFSFLIMGKNRLIYVFFFYECLCVFIPNCDKKWWQYVRNIVVSVQVFFSGLFSCQCVFVCSVFPVMFNFLL